MHEEYHLLPFTIILSFSYPFLHIFIKLLIYIQDDNIPLNTLVRIECKDPKPKLLLPKVDFQRRKNQNRRGIYTPRFDGLIAKYSSNMKLMTLSTFSSPNGLPLISSCTVADDLGDNKYLLPIFPDKKRHDQL